MKTKSEIIESIKNALNEYGKDIDIHLGTTSDDGLYYYIIKRVAVESGRLVIEGNINRFVTTYRQDPDVRVPHMKQYTRCENSYVYTGIDIYNIKPNVLQDICNIIISKCEELEDEELSKEEIVIEECSMRGLLEVALKFIPEDKYDEFLDACIERGDA